MFLEIFLVIILVLEMELLKLLLLVVVPSHKLEAHYAIRHRGLGGSGRRGRNGGGSGGTSTLGRMLICESGKGTAASA